VRAGRIAPTTIVTRQSIIRRAKVCCCDKNWWASRVAPLWFISTLYFKTSTATKAIVEQGCAECCSIHTIALAVQVTVPASTAWTQEIRSINFLIWDFGFWFLNSWMEF
jgi:uncharacterized protein YneR